MASATSDAHHAAEASSGGLPQFDFSTWGGQIFWLAITFGIMYFLLSRFVLPKIESGINDRNDRIADDLDSAARMQREAETALSEYEKSLADAKAKAHNIAATTRSSVEAEIASEIEAADADLSRKAAAAEVQTQSMRAEAMKSADDIAEQIATDLVNKLTGKKITAKLAKLAVSKA